ncbi:MAG: 2-C-methyl-D-erythritol 4-phosphate cytidylyltransferase [Candidatus Omnitrophota bacterium]
MKISAIVPAAGIGKRMVAQKGEARPKQFWPFGSSTILETILLELERCSSIREIIIVCRRHDRSFCFDTMVKKAGLKKVKRIVAGGKRRTDSVKNGLAYVARSSSHVLIQDAVRPFITHALISHLVKKIGTSDGIIVAKPVVPTIKEVKNGRIIRTISRDGLWEAETPQLFKKKNLIKAFEQVKKESATFTDEASLVEAIGGTVKVFKNSNINLKITTVTDYNLAKRIKELPMVKVGMGYDIHRLVEGRALMIGGIKIPFHKGCLGHSDGDPLLHAIADGLLGAASLGDIGEHFPDTQSKYKNRASRYFVSKVMDMIHKKSFVLSHVDATVIIERPNLRKFKDAITKSVANILCLDTTQVNIKAKTKEGLESEGAGYSVSAQAVVTIVQK